MSLLKRLTIPQTYSKNPLLNKEIEMTKKKSQADGVVDITRHKLFKPIDQGGFFNDILRQQVQ